MTANRFLSPSLMLFLAASIFLDVPITSAGRQHRQPLERRAVEKPDARKPTEETEEQEDAETPLRFPLFLAFGEELPSPGNPETALLSADRFLNLFASIRTLRLNPWVRWDDGTGSEEKHADHKRRLNRLGYLVEKARLFDELVRTTSEISAMAESLAQAGQWSPADAALIEIEAQRVRLYGKEIDDQIARLRRKLPSGEGRPVRFRRDYSLPELEREESEDLRLLHEEALAAMESVKLYEREMLPLLEKMVHNMEEAHRNGEVGLSRLARHRCSFTIARAEYLDLVWKLNALVLDFEEETGQPVRVAGEAKETP